MRKLAIVALFFILGTTASADTLYIPMAGKTPGANLTFFSTDLRIFNRSTTEPIQVELRFLKQGEDGRNAPGTVVTVPAREAIAINDVAGFLEPGVTAAVGAIRLSSAGSFVASSRTWTPDPNRPFLGTYGQFVPALAPSAAAKKSVVLHVVSLPEFRTNVGAMNPGTSEAVVSARLFGFDGTALGHSAQFTLPPQSTRQSSLYDLFGGAYLTSGYVVFESAEPVFTWASAVDNFSGDGIFIVGSRDGE